MKTDKDIVFFREQLLHWHHTQNFRAFPWKQEKDPYKIWLSEIILQQTRSEQGLPYYLKFVEAYPDVVALANAEDEAVFKMWQGLGYYNRCKNLLFTARTVRDEFDGVFPRKYADVLDLKGVGAYTAAAISSFAYNEPYAVLDGNVFRVLSRYKGIATPIDTTDGKKEFTTLANDCLDRDKPAAYNQAIMDFGATVCTPKSPSCGDCPLASQCLAYKQQLQTLLPVKEKKIKVRKRYLNYFICHYQDRIYVQKRTEKDIWQNLYEFYLIESNSADAAALFQERFGQYLEDKVTFLVKQEQKLTHQQVYSSFYKAVFKTLPEADMQQGQFMTRQGLEELAFPKTIISFLNNKSYF